MFHKKKNDYMSTAERRIREAKGLVMVGTNYMMLVGRDIRMPGIMWYIGMWYTIAKNCSLFRGSSEESS